MRILYLYAEVMGYVLAPIKELVQLYGAQVHVVHWDTKKLTPYRHNSVQNTTFYPRSIYSTPKINELLTKLNPDLLVVSGWMDKGYLQVARLARQRGIPVVAGLDDQWHGTIRQYGASFFRFVLKRYFTHAWVAGPYQFEFARRLGFEKKNIIFNLYSAELPLFNDAYTSGVDLKLKKYPHRFLFAGRFEKVKAVDLLVEAWENLGAGRIDWELKLIGNGSLSKYLTRQANVTVVDFMQPEALSDEIRDAGCFVLPSRYEPWGVVLHEFAAAGLPIICSDTCGAAAVFLNHGINGFRFETNCVKSLSNQMHNIVNLPDSELSSMSKHSHYLGQQITPAMSAASLVSIIK